MFDELTLQLFLEDLEHNYDEVLTEYPDVSSLGEINSYEFVIVKLFC